jgi:hypothetical protein
MVTTTQNQTAIDRFFRKREPWMYLTTVIGVATIVSFWFPSPQTNAITNEMTKMTSVISFFMLTLGALSQYLVHVPAIYNKKQGWLWDLFFIGELTIFLLAVIAGGVAGPLDKWINTYLRTPLGLGLACLFAPYIYRALLRSFTAKSIPVLIMIVITLVVWLGQAPLFYSNIPGLYGLGNFVQTGLSAGGGGVYQLTIGLVSAITCIRTLLGREKGYLGR